YPGRKRRTAPALELEGREERGEGRGRRRRTARTPGAEAAAGQGRPQQLLLGPPLRRGLEVQGPHPLGGPDGGTARRAGPLRGAPHGRGAEPEPAVRGAQGTARRSERRGHRED